MGGDPLHDDPSSVAAVASHIQWLSAAVDEPDDAAAALSAVLIDGQNPAALARAAGIGLAERYLVVGLSIPNEHADRAPSPAAAEDRLARVRSAVAGFWGGKALPLLGVRGGTILVPADSPADTVASELFARLCRAARAPLAATVMATPMDGIPQTTDMVHDLLDIVHRLGYSPRLYRFEDLALEYQLTRLGSAAEQLDSVLEPISPHPDLVQTLKRHIHNNFHRQQTARALNIHSNTVDYRLRRVKELTGLDPYRLTDLWRLQSALITYSYRHGGRIGEKPAAEAAPNRRGRTARVAGGTPT